MIVLSYVVLALSLFIMLFLFFIQWRILWVLEYRTKINFKDHTNYKKLPSMIKMIFQFNKWSYDEYLDK